jgi:hypothetical protein
VTLELFGRRIVWQTRQFLQYLIGIKGYRTHEKHSPCNPQSGQVAVHPLLK